MNSWDKYRDNKIVYQSGLRAARYGASGSFTVEEWCDLCKRYNNACARCGATVLLTADHIVPLSRKGTNDIGNIQPLCKPCNSHKRTKLMSELNICPPPKRQGENRGGERTGAGRPHRHILYVCVELIDAQGVKDFVYTGNLLRSSDAIRRAEKIAAHHVSEQARSVRILKRLCCSIGESVELKVVKASAEIV